MSGAGAPGSKTQEGFMMDAVTRFARSESGAVTVDWVVLTAGIVGLCLATLAVITDGIQGVSQNINNTITDNSIISTVFD
jgi:Flp pilus assembly pilin Flp